MLRYPLLALTLAACTVTAGKADSGDSSADSGDSGADSGDSSADSGDSGADSGSDTGADSGGDSGGDSGDTGIPTDADGDGYFADDCDDGDATVHPGADEICNGEDDDCDGVSDESPVDGVPAFVDADGDGFGDAPTTTCDLEGEGVAAVDGDCDDARAEVYPGAPETCDGLDDDCDGAVDSPDPSGAVTFYADDDRDGYGRDDAGQAFCELPAEAWSFVGGDCDDARDDVNPDADEVCDGVDDDCDDLVDDDDPSVSGAPDWYADTDADGHGDPDATLAACAAPAGHVATGDDCDDADGDVYPGAVEVCDGRDDDCDDLVDDADPDLDATTTATWFPDGDADGFGVAEGAVAACAAPPGTAAVDGDCDDGAADVYPGATEVADDGVDQDCDGADLTDVDEDGYVSVAGGGEDCDDGDAAIHPAASDGAGDGVDQDCDGVDGTDGDRDGWASTASGGEDCDDADADVSPDGTEVLGNGIDDDCDGTADQRDVGGLAVVLTGTSTTYDVGLVLSAVGDVTCDGVDDLVAGDGYARLVPGPLASAGATFTSADAFAGLGGISAAIPAGDVDGDGCGDLYLGWSSYDGSVGSNNGIAVLLSGPVGVAEAIAGATATLEGSAASVNAGRGLAAVGDVDDDGLPDVVVAHYAIDPIGLAVYSGGFADGDTEDDATFSVTGVGANWSADPAAGEDLDGDGFDDLVVGCQRGGSGTSGAAFVFFGPLAGDVDVAFADWTVEGSVSSEQYGRHVSTGDLDGDGTADLYVGAYSYAPGVVFLSPLAAGSVATADADAPLVSETGYDCYAGDCAGEIVDDLDGDGVMDLAVGQGHYDASSGRAYVLLSPVDGPRSLADADARLDPQAAGDGLGYAVAGGVDGDGDGLSDLLLLADDRDDGTVYLLPGWR